MTSKPFLSVYTGRLFPASLRYRDVSQSAAMETQQSVTPQDQTRDVVVNLTLIVQSLRHGSHRRWVKLKFFVVAFHIEILFMSNAYCVTFVDKVALFPFCNVCVYFRTLRNFTVPGALSQKLHCHNCTFIHL